MPDADDLPDKDCETELKQLVLRELGDQMDPNEATVDAIVNAIMALVQLHRRP
jgi:hypothetical protein